MSPFCCGVTGGGTFPSAVQKPGRALSVSAAARFLPTSTTETSTSSTLAAWTRGTANFLVTFVTDPSKKETG